MAKELPYFKFEPSEWLEGEVQICSDAAIVCFTNLCSGYWLKLGSISYAFALHKYMRKDASVLQELINCNIIALQEDQIKIKFLDIQLKEFKSVSNQRSLAAKKRWSKPVDTKGVHANAFQKLSKSNAIREEKRREEKKREEKEMNTASPFSFYKSLLDYGFKKELVSDWLKVRKTKKATNTETAFKKFIKQVEESKQDINYILETCISKDWKGFESKWLENELKNSNNGKQTNTPGTKQAYKFSTEEAIKTFTSNS